MILGQFDSLLLLIQKIFAISGSVIYLIFSTVVVRQVASMSKIVHDKFNTILIIFSWIHLFGAVILVLLAVFSS